MRKLFILSFLFLFASVLTFAQTTTFETETDVTKTEAERLIDKYGGAMVDGAGNLIDDIGTVLTALGEKLEKPVEDVFNIYVHYYTAKGYINLIPVIFFIFTVIPFFMFYSRGNYTDRDWNVYATMTLIFGKSSGGFFIATVVCVFPGILYLVAPEYFVIQDILELTK